MATTKTLNKSVTVDPFDRDPRPVIHGYRVSSGRELTVEGMGRVRFCALVTNPRNGARWLDVIDRHGRWRSARPDRVKTVHTKIKARP